MIVNNNLMFTELYTLWISKAKLIFLYVLFLLVLIILLNTTAKFFQLTSLPSNQFDSLSLLKVCFLTQKAKILWSDPQLVFVNESRFNTLSFKGLVLKISSNFLKLRIFSSKKEKSYRQVEIVYRS